MRALALALVLGCGGRVEASDHDSPAEDSSVHDAAIDSRIDSRIADAIAEVADTGPDKRWPVTAKDAACMGLDRPACAGCHFRDGTWFMMPTDVPPPPPDKPIEPDLYEKCGLVPPGY